jgi:hypothetical protein
MELPIEYQNHKTEARQFPPTTVKHLIMTNVGQNMYCNVQKH